MTSDDKPKAAGAARTSASGRTRKPARPAPHVVEPRPRRYLIAALPGAQNPGDDGLLRLLEDDPGVRVRRRLPGRGAPAKVAFPAIVVAEMTEEHAAALRSRQPQLYLEPDLLLGYTEVPVPPRRWRPAPAVVPAGVCSTFTFLVRDRDGTPVPGATVVVSGQTWPAQAVTGPDGRATVTLAGEIPESITTVVVKPRSSYWGACLHRPSLATDRDNLVELVKLSETFDGFPERQVFGWGQQAMNLDRLPPTFRGAGVKIAIIDSGVDVEHPDLRDRVGAGIDLVGRQPDGWAVDTARHGSPCAAIITGADDGAGVVGFAVEAEVHACKIFPGGRLSDLIEALDYCIEQRVDVVSLSLGTDQPSHLVAAKIEQARHAGVACVVAAGNDGGPVRFPGTLPTVLTVAAIGKADAFPAGTSHEAEILAPCTPEGYFSASFTCHGPQVDVCAPGVAVLSAVPPQAYAAGDGTSMAAPHVVGLAALVLAHHGDFRAGYAGRDARRVDRLFQIIRSSCVPIDVGDPGRTGAGLPDALRALGPALTHLAPDLGETRVLFDQFTTEMDEARLLTAEPGTVAANAATGTGPAGSGSVGPVGSVGQAGTGGSGPVGSAGSVGTAGTAGAAPRVGRSTSGTAGEIRRGTAGEHGTTGLGGAAGANGPVAPNGGPRLANGSHLAGGPIRGQAPAPGSAPATGPVAPGGPGYGDVAEAAAGVSPSGWPDALSWLAEEMRVAGLLPGVPGLLPGVVPTAVPGLLPGVVSYVSPGVVAVPGAVTGGAPVPGAVPGVAPGPLPGPVAGPPPDVLPG